jgi:hypothetical protein
VYGPLPSKGLHATIYFENLWGKQTEKKAVVGTIILK